MKKLILLITMTGVSVLGVRAQSDYYKAVTGMNPAGYWPLQAGGAPAAATMETNYGTLGAVGDAYYVATNMSQATLGVSGALTNSGDNDAATYFSGVNLNGGCGDYLFVPRVSPGVTIKPPFTLECWFNTTNSGFGDLMGEGGSGLNSAADGGNAGGVRLSYGGGSNPSLQMYLFNGSGQTRQQLTTTNGSMLPLGAWHYCVATFDGTNAYLYVDGVKEASRTYASMGIDTWSPLTIGAGFWRHSGYASTWVSGSEDEVAVYTNALTAAQVNNHWLAATTSGSNYMQTVLADHPVLYYRMDAPIYTNEPVAACPVATNDGSAPVEGAYLSGTRPGAVSGPAILGVTNEVATPINGVNACIDAGSAAAFDPTGTQAFTAACWFKGNPADQRPVQALMSQGTNWSLNVVGSDGKVTLVDGAGSVASTGVLNDGRWHFVVGVYDGTNNYLYVDGALDNMASATGSLTGDAGHALYLGGNAAYPFTGDASQEYFAGAITEAAYFTNALTAGDVQQLYGTTVTPPLITEEPAATSIKLGRQTNVFNAVVTGGLPLTYQWYYNTVSNYAGASALSDGPTGSGSVVSGATTATLTISDLQDGDNGYYYMEVTNSYGSVTSLVSQLTVFTSPTITAQEPSNDFTLFASQDDTLSVAAKGAAPLNYQWYTNGVADTAAGTNSTYALNGVTVGMSGTTFQCVVTNSLGAATNTLVTMTVEPLPSNAYASNVLSMAPTAYWPMHETTPPVHGDIETNYGSLGVLGTGYYNDWNLNGGDPGSNMVVHGIFGALSNDTDTAVDFDPSLSSSDYSYLLIPHSTPATTLKPPFTMECWFDGYNSSYGDIFGQGGSAVNGGGNGSPWDGVRIFWAGQSSPPQIQIYVGHGTGNSRFQTSGTNYAIGEWHYVVLTCDTNDNFTLYVDGKEDGHATYANYVPAVANPLLVGAGYWRQNGPIRQFRGAVDEVAVYTNVLTASDVSTHYSAGTGGAAGAYYAAVTNDHPVLYYRMDSPAYHAPVKSSWPVLTNYGRVAIDGHYSPGTLPGAVGGVMDNAGNFAGGLLDTNAMPGNGLSAYADAGYNPAFNPTGNTPVTIAAWFKGNPADPRYQNIVGHSDNSWRIAMDQYGKLHFNPGTGNDLISQKVYNDGRWHQVVGVYDGSTDYLYVDGVLDTNASVSGSVSGSTDDVLLGADPQYTGTSVNTGTGRQFAGDLCEVAFWNGVALNANQIQSLYGSIGIMPQLIKQPSSGIASAGTHYTNTVQVTGTLPLAYQWYQNGSPVIDQTNATLDYDPLSTTDGGNYFVIITNNYGAVTSSVVNLTVIQAPVITQGIISLTKTNHIILYAGAHPSFNVTAIGAVPLSYQWFTNDVQATGATNNSYMLPSVQTGGLTNFFVKVTNTEGATTSTVVSVSVVADPSAPYPQAVLADRPLGYWPLNEGPGDYAGNNGAIANDYWNADNGIYTNTDLSGPSYSINSDPNTYSAWFGTIDYSNCLAYGINNVNFATPYGSTNFTVEAWVYAYPQTADAGIISKGLGNGGEQFCLGVHNNAFRFFVRDASGAVHAAYSSISPNILWYHLVGVCDETDGSVSLYVNGKLAGSATITPGTGILNTTNAMLIGSRPSGTNASNNNDQFLGAISGVAVYNYALSASQVLSQYYAAGIAPQVTQDVPSSTNVNQNGSVSISVKAAGTQPLAYQWYSASIGALVGQTNTTLSLPGVAANDSYYVMITNLYGSVQSGYVSINIVSGVPQIVNPALPPNVYVSSNSVYPYSVTATGTEPFSYQWYSGGVPIPGANQSSYSLMALTNTTITVAITNVYGSVTSNPSKVIIIPPLKKISYVQAIEALGPVGYWPMQETNAPAPSDIETNLGTLGPLANAYYLDSPVNPVVGHDVAGALNSDGDPATSFTGQNNCYMAAPAISTNMALNAPFSVELWAWPANTSFGMAVAKNGYVGLNSGLPGSGRGNLCGWSVDWARGGSTRWDLQLYHNVAGQNNAVQIFGPTTAGTTTGWQYVVFTYDGTTVKFYWNGQLITSGNASYVPDTWSPLCVGGGRLAQGTPGNQGVRLFDGLEDEVALYTNVLSAADIQAHYQAGTNSSPVTPYKQLVLNDHPLVYYRMDASNYTTPPASDNPALINYGSVPVTGNYPPNTVPGGVSGPDLVGLGSTNVVASPINGLNAAADAGYAPIFNRTNGEPLTAMIWAKGYPTDGRIQSPMSHGDHSWHFEWNSSGQVIWSSGNSSGDVFSSQTVNDGQWHLLTGVYDGSKNLLYIDGALAGSAPAGAIVGSSSDVYLGGSPDYVDTTNEEYFSGSICQAAFFTNALTAAQIQTVYNAANISLVPSLSVAPENGKVVVTWNTGTLLSSTNVTGPYSPITGAISPYTNAPDAPKMFYRVSNP